MQDNQRKKIIALMAVALVCRPRPIDELLKDSNIFLTQESLFCRSGNERLDKNANVQIPLKLLQNFFPDWKERVNYQNERTKACISAQKKLKEERRLRFSNSMHMSTLSKDEKDALDYFNGRGFYEYHQNPKIKPNIFDTRQSFLVKMQDRTMRNNFLTSYRRYHKNHKK